MFSLTHCLYCNSLPSAHHRQLMPMLKPCSTTLLLNSWATSLSYSTSPFFIWTVKDSSEGITRGLGLWLGSWSCDRIWMWTESVLGPYPVPSRSPDLAKEVRLSLDSQVRSQWTIICTTQSFLQRLVQYKGIPLDKSGTGSLFLTNTRHSTEKLFFNRPSPPLSLSLSQDFLQTQRPPCTAKQISLGQWLDTRSPFLSFLLYYKRCWSHCWALRWNTCVQIINLLTYTLGQSPPNLYNNLVN